MRLLSVLPLLALCACAPTVIRASDAELSATARGPQGTFQFACNPVADARRSGQTVTLDREVALTCRSTDGQATLTLIVIGADPAGPQTVQANVAPAGQPAQYRTVTVTPAPQDPRTFVLVTLPGEAGAPPVSLIGPAQGTRSGMFTLPWTAGRDGEFSANLGNVTVSGQYRVRADW